MSDNYPVDGELRRQADRIDALEQAHAELAAKVEQLTRHVGMVLAVERRRIALIESPAAAPDPVCASCGHGSEDHTFGQGECMEPICGCAGFVPTAEPEPAPLDPVKCSPCNDTGVIVFGRHIGNALATPCPFCKDGAR